MNKYLIIGIIVITLLLIGMKKSADEYTITSNCIGGMERVFDGNPETEANCPLSQDMYVGAEFNSNKFIYRVGYAFWGEISNRGEMTIILQTYNGQIWQDAYTIYHETRGGDNGGPFTLVTGNFELNAPTKGVRLIAKGDTASAFYPTELNWDACTDSGWEPLPEQVTCGIEFTQRSICGNERTAVGTMNCQTCTDHRNNINLKRDVWKTCSGDCLGERNDLGTSIDSWSGC